MDYLFSFEVVLLNFLQLFRQAMGLLTKNLIPDFLYFFEGLTPKNKPCTKRKSIKPPISSKNKIEK